jgi:predicted Zn-dependent protease
VTDLLRFPVPKASGLRRFLRGAALAAGALAAAATPAAAQRMSYVRDAEVEQLIRDYLAPILRVAGQPPAAIKLALVNDRSFNASVSHGRRMTVFVGAIIDSGTPNQLIGVLAHETAHIAGGHLARLAQELPRAQVIAIIGTILGAGALVGAASNRNIGMSGAAPMGMLSAGSELAQRSLLSFMRGEEAAADRAAVTYLNATKQSPKGMLDTLKRIAEQQMFLSARVDKYLLSHPLASERIAALDAVARESPYFEAKDPPGLQLRHDLARAKLIAFTGRQDEINRRYAPSDASLPARYARAIYAHRFSRGGEAQGLIDGLIKAQPNNPFFWELKGQNLLESGQAAAAVGPLRKAASLAPGQALLRVMLGHALMSTGTPANVQAAIKELTVAIQRDPEVHEAYIYLAQAYEKAGKTAEAELTIAENYFLLGAYEEARLIAKRAQARFPQGSPGWRKADEIVAFKAN